MEVYLEFYSLAYTHTCWWMGTLTLSDYPSPSSHHRPLMRTHITSYCTCVSNYFLFIGEFLMLFSLVLQSTLNELEPVHGEERTYFCNVCNKSFSRKYIMKKHQCVHSGERPFCFDVGNKSFSQKHTLKIHQRIHSGVWPFCSHVCKKSFSQKAHLKDHQRIHSGERPFCSDVCNKAFSHKNTLKTHQRIHSGVRPLAVICVIIHSVIGAIYRDIIAYILEASLSCDVMHTLWFVAVIGPCTVTVFFKTILNNWIIILYWTDYWTFNYNHFDFTRL
jgi:hypothetical protein